MKARAGSIVKRKPRRRGAKPTWWARVTYIDPKTGKRHDLQRRGQSKAHARDLLQALLREIDATEGQGPLNERRILTLQIEIRRFEVYRLASQTGPHRDAHFAKLLRSRTNVKSSLFTRGD